jgi:hypothetical protein
VRPGIHRARITITFGPALQAPAAADGDREAEYAEITRRLRAAVEGLMGDPSHAR